MDVLLHRSWADAPAEERQRARVLSAVAFAMLILGILDGTLVVALTTRWVLTTVLLTIFGTMAFAPAAFILRFRRGSLSLPALVLCVPILGVLGFSSLCQGYSYVSHNAWNLSVSLFCTYLIGPRAGAAVLALVCGEVVLASTLDYLGHGLPVYLGPHDRGEILVRNGTNLLGMVATGAIGLLYASSRERAQREIRDAMAKVGTSEANLVALIENTRDWICSLDREGRIITINSAFRRACRSLGGREVGVGDDLYEMLQPDARAEARERLARALAGERVVTEQCYELGGRRRWVEMSYCPIAGEAPGQARGVTLVGRNVTKRKEDEQKLAAMHRQLVDASRRAGMAEVANGILHNVGNTLNSVNVSVNLMTERVQASRVTNLGRAVEMLRAHEHDLAAFLAGDELGRKLGAYLAAVAEHLVAERDFLRDELGHLGANVHHIGAIIHLQQDHARAVGVIESVALPAVVEDALRLHESAFARLGITIERRFADLPVVPVDRHRLLQILVNLIGNARDAVSDGDRSERVIAIHLEAGAPGRVRLRVRDNGAGIAPEHLRRIFSQGFTTKQDGHGFGLHMSALAASEMGGALTAASDGRGHGATFTLELPLAPPPAAAEAPA